MTVVMQSSWPDWDRSFEPPEPEWEWRGHGRRYWAGLFLLINLTLVVCGWFVYHWFWEPVWVTFLPAIFQEALDLMEWAAAFTIAFVWTGLWWRRRFYDELPPPIDLPLLSVEKMYELSPGAFERYVAGLFRLKGYRVFVRGSSGDHGVDVEVFGAEDVRAIVQCKRYQSTVGEKTVRDLYGTMLHEKAGRAFLVTTSEISFAARRWAAGKPITLIDGKTLVAIATSLREQVHAADIAEGTA